MGTKGLFSDFKPPAIREMYIPGLPVAELVKV
jgi:hypothetical protein